MDPQQFARLLAHLGANPPAPPGDPGGFRIDSWIHNFATEIVGRMAFSPWSGFRADTATGLFEQQLQHVIASDYNRPFPGLQMRGLMPAASGIPAGAQTVVQRGWDVTGRPKLLVNETSEIPRVGLHAVQNVGQVAGYGIKWRANYDELQAAAMAGADINSMGLTTARMVQEREIDLLLASGNARLGLVGLLSHATKAPAAAGAGVELYTTGAPAAFVGDWDGVATAAQILNDVSILMAKYRTDGSVHYPTDFIFGANSWSRIETLQAFASSDKTVLEVLRARYPGINFQHVWRCNNANAGLANDRCVLYERSKFVCEAVVPLEPIQLPPSWDGYGWDTVTYARAGGVLMADTTGIVYIDM